jgi:hypothetical protein
MCNAEIQILLALPIYKTDFSYAQPTGTGGNHEHSLHTGRASPVAMIPVGNENGPGWRLSNHMDFLVRGVRCPPVRTIISENRG